ncbi:MAG: hypothetical protein V1663_05360 [archaeon]
MVMVKLVAVILIFYGLLGMAVGGYALYYVSNNGLFLGEQITDVSSDIHQEFIIIAQTMRDASNSSKNAELNIKSAQESLNSAQPILSNVKESSYNIGNSINFTILGECPLCSTSYWFYKQGDELENLGNNLKETSDSLGESASGMDKLSEDFSQMADGMDKLSNHFIGSTGQLASPNMNLIVRIALCYLIFLHFLLFGIGYGLFSLPHDY